MKNKKKLGKMIALALVLGSCSANVTEAVSSVNIYGNSPNKPTDYTTQPSERSLASGCILDFDSNFNFTYTQGITSVFGGYAHNVDASSNTLNFYSGEAYDVCAGYVYGNGNANGNTLKFNNGTAISVYGGGVNGTGLANDNSVEVNGGTIGDNGGIYGGVYGGFNENGDANNNVVTVNNGSVVGAVGGTARNGDANNNVVTIKGEVYRSSFNNGAVGGEAVNGNANDNVVNVSANMHNSGLVGGVAYGNSNNNTVNIKAGANNVGAVFGGESFGTNISNIIKDYTSNSNTIIIDTNGNIGVVNCGYIANTATAYKVSSNDNKIIVDNGNVGDNNSSMFASSIEIDSSKANDTSYIQALNNTVTLNNGKAQGSVFAVYIGDANSIGTSYVNNKTPITISGNNITINGGEIGEVYGICDADVVASTLEVKDNSGPMSRFSTT